MSGISAFVDMRKAADELRTSVNSVMEKAQAESADLTKQIDVKKAELLKLTQEESTRRKQLVCVMDGGEVMDLPAPMIPICEKLHDRATHFKDMAMRYKGKLEQITDILADIMDQKPKTEKLAYQPVIQVSQYPYCFDVYGDLVVCGAKNIEIFNLVTGKRVMTLTGHTKCIISASFSPDGTYLASGSWDNTVKLWDMESGECVHTFTEHTTSANSVVWSSCGGLLASGACDKLNIWNVKTKECLHSVIGYTAYVRSAAGNMLVCKTRRQFHFLNMDTGKRVHTRNAFACWSMALSSDGKLFALGSYNKEIILQHAETGNIVHTFKVTADVLAVAFSPDGKLLAFGSRDKIIRVWDVATRKVVHTFTGHTDPVTSVMFSKTKPNVLVSASYDDIVRTWKLD